MVTARVQRGQGQHRWAALKRLHGVGCLRRHTSLVFWEDLRVGGMALGGVGP